MRLPVISIILLSFGLAATVSAAEPAPATKPATPAAAKPASKPTEQKTDDKAAVSAAEKSDKAPASAAGKTEDAKQADTKPDAKSPADVKPSPQRFTPSEQVRADFDVSFPIDI